MSKDTIKVNMNVYDIPIVVEQLKTLEQENKQLNNILTELEKWLKKRIKNVPETMVEVYEDTLILDKIQKLKEKYK